jgi:hypothetical protein
MFDPRRDSYGVMILALVEAPAPEAPRARLAEAPFRKEQMPAAPSGVLRN